MSPTGAKNSPGTREQPLASIDEALRKARELRRLAATPMNQPVRIVLSGGTYRLDRPLLVRPEDSGTAASPTIIAAAPGERPILSGGVLVHGWRKSRGPIAGLPAPAQGRVWVSDPPQVAGRVLEFRQLYVNGRKAVRAREPDGDTLERLAGWDSQAETAWIPSRSTTWRHVPRVELILHQQWEVSMLRVKSVRVERESTSLTFHRPESRIQFEHPYPWPVMSPEGNAPFFMANAVEFLDTPGEWYQEMPAGRIVYWPSVGEDMTRAAVVVPWLETLVDVYGTLDKPVAHVQFHRVSFEYTTWLRPSKAGHVPLQAGMYLLDAYRLLPKGTAEKQSLDNVAWIGRPPAAVAVSAAHHVRFEQCRFGRLASTGLDLRFGTHDNAIERCEFRDIGGNGILVGCFADGGTETHVPYHPADEREICTRERIANNVVTDCATEDWGCVGIGVGYARQIAVEHNEVGNLPYMGISVGWGWTPAANCMRDNRVHANHVHHVATRMCDVGGIYTLSAQPGSIISENAIHDIHLKPYVHMPDHWYYIYLDEGSSHIAVRDNWCPDEKFFENATGPGNRWERNGPMVSPKIRDAAGPESPF